QAMHDAVRAGAELEISVPRNLFPLVDGARNSILLAGGIGVTPLLSMAEQLAKAGAPFELHYCTRSRERTAFRDRILGTRLATHVKFHSDDGPASQQLDMLALVATPCDGVHLYVCGPGGFIDAVLGAARSAGWPEAQLHYEFFSAAPARADGDTRFEVEIA